MNKKLMWTLGIILLALVLVVGFYFIISYEECVGEFESMAVGVAPQFQRECCEGLTARAPEGWVGGAWCVHPSYWVTCGTLFGKEGIYAFDPAETNPRPSKFLKEQDCSLLYCFDDSDCESGQMCVEGVCEYYGTLDFYTIQNGECVNIGNDPQNLCSTHRCFGGMSNCEEYLGIINPDKKYLCVEFWYNHPELYKEDFVCYFIYDPVCGDDGRTYSNDCVACRSGVTLYTKGEC